MERFDKFLRISNPYYHSYKQMRDVEIEEEQKAKRNGTTVPTIHMAFKRNPTDDVRRYNVPKIGEIAVVFTGEDGLPPQERDFQVFPKQTNDSNALNKLNILSQHTDPMVYTLLFLNGEPGWHPGIQHNELHS